MRGQPHGTPASPTDYATGLTITDNTIRNAARAGIYVAGLKQSLIAHNLILDSGTQFLSDGTTAIASVTKPEHRHSGRLPNHMC